MNGSESIDARTPGEPSWKLYLGAAGLVMGYYVLLGSTLRGLQSSLMFKLLGFYIGKPFGVAASATNNFLPLDLYAELRSVFCNPVFYSAVLIGFYCIRRPQELYRGAVPALIVFAPLIILTVIPNPMMLVGLSMLIQLMSLVIPYFLLGGLVGWGAFKLQSKTKI